MLPENKNTVRSDCPVNFMVEIFGDKWSLLIIRDIIFFGKNTYSEFLKSDERIATNILSSKLASLENAGILSKTAHPTDKRKDVYALTEKGQDLIPVVLEIFNWGFTHKSPHTTASETFALEASEKFVKRFRRNKQKTIEEVKDRVRGGGFIFSNK